MSNTRPYPLGLKLCSLASLAMMLLAFIPQIHLWIVRGRDWNGAYVSPHVDEPLYSAYINSLIEGSPRKNDPFRGKGTPAGSALPESTFSIQFLPAYAIALPARILGLSASRAFIILTAAGALTASLAIFWLLNATTGDAPLAAAGTVFVLCLGGIVGRHGVFGTFVDVGIAAFPFLRRYQPAVAFPLLFVFQSLVWNALTGKSKTVSRVSAIIAGLVLAILIFSYFYLWTGALAWLACIGVLWFCLRRMDRWKTVTALSIVGGIATIALIPYAFLVSHRSPSLDEQLTLILTHSPDIWRLPEILAAGILIVLGVSIFRGRLKGSEPKVIFSCSLALLPFVVFNQQVVTGKILQAFHYEIFVVNYSTLLGLMVTVAIFWQPAPRRLVMWIAGFSFAWGIVAVGLPARVAFVPLAVADDLRIPVLLRLKELASQDITPADLDKAHSSSLVFSPSVALVTQLPTWTSQGTLLDVGGIDFGSLTREERKKFFFMHLYYSNADTDSLRQALNGRADKSREELSTARTVVFGYERTSPSLTNNFQPIRDDEIEREVKAYQVYVKSFSRDEAVNRPLTYAVIPAASRFDFTNLDRWYERSAGELVGGYTVYRLTLQN
jgi:hypothetical protein